MTVEEALEKIKGVQVVPIDPNVKHLILLDQRYISETTGASISDWLSENNVKAGILWVDNTSEAIRLLELP